MIRMKYSITLFTVIGSLAALGCEESEECQRARMQTSKSWAAAQRIAKTQLGPGGDVSTWEEVQKHAELLQSAFATPQITWQSAEKTRAELNELFSQYEQRAPKDSTLTSFRALLERVNKEQADTAEICK